MHKYDIFHEKERKAYWKEKETNLNLCRGMPTNYMANIQDHVGSILHGPILGKYLTSNRVL